MQKMRENVIVASGNQPVFPADQMVFNDDGSTNVKKGQIVIWDPSTYKSLGPTITTATNDRIAVSVGIDRHTLRSGFGDHMYGDSIKAAKASAPSFGVSHVVDLLYNITDNGDSFTVQVHVTDDETENQFPYNTPEIRPFTVDRTEVACSDCPSGIDSTKLSCLLRDKINGEIGPASKMKRSVYQNKNLNEEDVFTAHVLFGASNTATPTTFQYCISAVDSGECEGCVEGDVALHSFKYTDADGVVQTETFDFVNNDAGSAVLLDRITAAIDQINAKIGLKGTKNGSAVLVKGVGPCASQKIEVNTCDAGFVLQSAVDTPITPCNGGGSGTNPFADPISEVNNCPNCGDQTTDITFLGGLRFVAKPIEIPVGSIWEAINNPKGILLRELKVYPSDGFKCSKTFVRTVQKPRSPENLGYQIAWEEYTNSNGGRGRDHLNYNENVGNLNIPRDGSRANSPVSNVSDVYCKYGFEHYLPRTRNSVHGQAYNIKGTTIVAIPSDASTTISEFEAIMNNYLDSVRGMVLRDINCQADPQQDQIESVAGGTDRYPDSNGYLI